MRVILTGAGAAGGFIVYALGGCDVVLRALLLFMAIDYSTGFVVAGVFKKSKKCGSGALSSSAGFKGLIKKGMQLLIVLVGHQIDIVLGTDFVRSAVIIAFIANELVSIMENAGLMGIPWPPMLKKALDILHEKGDIENDG